MLIQNCISNRQLSPKHQAVTRLGVHGTANGPAPPEPGVFSPKIG
jgi:hypothetical protein